MVSAPEKVRENIAHVLQKELKYFLREYTIAEELEKWSKHGDNERALKAMQNYLKQLKKFEFREQLFASVDKLKGQIEDFLKFIASDVKFRNIKNRIITAVNEMKVFEGKLMIETTQELEPHIKGKTVAQVDWGKVREIAKKVLDDLRALIILDKQLDKTIGG